MKKEIWKILTSKKQILFIYLFNDVNNNVSCKKQNLKQYLNVLKIAEYISINTSVIQDQTIINFKKNTGEKYPTYSNGILIDNNTKEEFVIHKHKNKEFKSVLKYYLKAIINLDKTDIVSSDLNKKFGQLWGLNTKDSSAATTKKHLDILVKKELIVITENSVRNSPVLIVNVVGIKKFYEEIKDKKIYGKML